MTITLVKCNQCNISFGMTLKRFNQNQKRGYNHYCSRKCFDFQQHKQIQYVCVQCNTNVMRVPSAVRGNIFCSMTCSATYNNKLNPKRQLQGQCPDCGKLMPKSRSLCVKCRNNNRFENQRLQDIQLPYFQASAKIRGHSRRVFDRSKQPLRCAKCGYEIIVEICHIKPIKSFSKETIISVINDINNLIALCPTHHAEFDRGLLTLNGSAAESRTRYH